MLVDFVGVINLKTGVRKLSGGLFPIWRASTMRDMFINIVVISKDL
jgi:hypothetical protein